MAHTIAERAWNAIVGQVTTYRIESRPPGADLLTLDARQAYAIIGVLEKAGLRLVDDKQYMAERAVLVECDRLRTSDGTDVHEIAGDILAATQKGKG